MSGNVSPVDGPVRAPAPNELVSITKAQRAAVVIALMGETVAKPIVETLDDASVAEAAKALESIGCLPKSVVIQIVVEFLDALQARDGAFLGGASMARKVISGLVGDDRSNAILGGAPKPAEVPERTDDAWERLNGRASEDIAAYLNGLPPNLIALILEKMNAELASDTLAALDETKIAPVMAIMVSGGASDPDLDGILAQMIRLEFLNAGTVDTKGDSRLDEVGAIVSLIPSATRETAFETLRSVDEKAYQTLRRSVLTVDKLPTILPRNQIPTLFRALDEKQQVQAIASLQLAHQPVADYLLDNISARLADRIKGDVADLPTPDPEAAEEVIRSLMRSLMDLRSSGEVVFAMDASD